MATLTLDRLRPTSTSSSSSSRCPFTDRLPFELRNEIFKLCFPTNTTSHSAEGIQAALSLARTCHKIRDEVIELYFEHNIFSFSTAFQMHKFLVNIGQEGRQAIREIEFAWDCDQPKQYIYKLKGCINLQTLNIGLIRGFLGGGGDYREFIWKLVRQLPRGLELKIREVLINKSTDPISEFFREDFRLNPLRRQRRFGAGIVKRLESQVKEDLRRVWTGLRKVRRRNADAALNAHGFYSYWFRLPKSREMVQTRWEMRRRRAAAVEGETKRRAARMV